MLRRLRREERGTAVVEFAVVAVLFISLIYGGITYGMVFWVKHTMTHAAAEGARSALNVTPGDTEAAISAATEKVESTLTASLGAERASYVTVSAAVAECDESAEDCITVTVSYPYEDEPVVAPLPLFPFVPDVLTATSVLELNS